MPTNNESSGAPAPPDLDRLIAEWEMDDMPAEVTEGLCRAGRHEEKSNE